MGQEVDGQSSTLGLCGFFWAVELFGAFWGLFRASWVRRGPGIMPKRALRLLTPSALVDCSIVARPYVLKNLRFLSSSLEGF